MYSLDKINRIKTYLTNAHQTIAVAESVTSGHLQAAFSQAEGAALFYQGGITVYNLGQKARHLMIEPIEAEACNCVSENVAIQMALQVAHNFTASYGIGITGYAATMPEKGVNELYAYYAICQGLTILRKGRIDTTETDALQVQLFYTDQVLDKLLQGLQAVNNAI
ncbi:CinA family protein [Deminuibacter soli]|uniref:Damage-inducible protein CinA n=1 Tax=Deminuibacter soli TaxID=2291815 RepID=A0A3E1NFW4_9BACT|nr:CinA family protein [Deminuibacter soli]RFM26850.1 damage-inducible protein CinA [Deminuibacter soli]